VLSTIAWRAKDTIKNKGYGNRAFHFQYFHDSIERYIQKAVQTIFLLGSTPAAAERNALRKAAIKNATKKDFQENPLGWFLLIVFLCSVVDSLTGNCEFFESIPLVVFS